LIDLLNNTQANGDVARTDVLEQRSGSVFRAVGN